MRPAAGKPRISTRLFRGGRSEKSKQIERAATPAGDAGSSTKRVPDILREPFMRQMVGAARLEPATPCSQGQNHIALYHPKNQQYKAVIKATCAFKSPLKTLKLLLSVPLHYRLKSFIACPTANRGAPALPRYLNDGFIVYQLRPLYVAGASFFGERSSPHPLSPHHPSINFVKQMLPWERPASGSFLGDPGEWLLSTPEFGREPMEKMSGKMEKQRYIYNVRYF